MMRRNPVRLPGGLPSEARSLQSGRIEGLPRMLALREIPSGSPWAALVRRFLRHRVAVAAAFVLAVLYLTALFAEIVAPLGPGTQDLDRLYCPPQLPRLNWQHGWYVPVVTMRQDPVTLRRTFETDPDGRVPLGFWVRGESYRLWGLFPLDRHLFGVDRTRAEAWQLPARDAAWRFLGADRFGRDVFSRLVFGARVSLSIGLASIAVTLALGILLGGVSGYAGGVPDAVIQRLIDVLNAIPQLPFWLALAAILPAEASPLFVYFAITLVLGLVGWAELARVVRGKVLALREEEFVVAARLLGASPARVLLRHLLPGISSHVLVVLTMSIPAMILGESSLSFLGLGLRAPVVSWGVMLQDTMSIQAVSSYPWLLAPAALIVLAVLCFNFLGDGLRDTADPSSHRGMPR